MPLHLLSTLYEGLRLWRTEGTLTLNTKLPATSPEACGLSSLGGRDEKSCSAFRLGKEFLAQVKEFEGLRGSGVEEWVSVALHQFAVVWRLLSC
ncbi:hypothetical protein INR49_008354, partial [Caranx melampygus]